MAHVQIRNVPPDVHRKLKARAAKAGMSLSEYLLAEVVEVAALPTLDEWVERVRKQPPMHFKGKGADLIRAEREERDRHLTRR
jgi:antitoxin FitA